MTRDQKIIIIGAGIFGLCLARQLALDGHKHITVVDRHVPPVPDGSSNDISRVIRFDYADEDYLDLAYEAYQRWRDDPKYKGIFYSSSYILACSKGDYGMEWIRKTTAALNKRGHPWTALGDAESTKQLYPLLTGELCQPNFHGYVNAQGGWADAAKAVTQVRDDCIELDVSFISGSAGTVTGFETDGHGKIHAIKTLNGQTLHADQVVLAAGAWSSSLVPMYNSVLSTAHAIGYMALSDAEIEHYKHLPIYFSSKTGWFNFPPHRDSRMLKMAIHGWGYTRTPNAEEASLVQSDTSAPQLRPKRQRANFAPAEAEARLRAGLREILPELAERPFTRLALCWYSDTPSGDFIMDHHPDFANLFVAGGGSGHAFKFLPVLGKYTALALKGSLPVHLAKKWRFRTEYRDSESAFKGDGSRGGPKRRELDAVERAKL